MKNADDSYLLTIPRNRIRRRVINAALRGLLRLLTDTTVTGLENIPEEGPVILAANHVSPIEPAVMAVAPRRPVEFVGQGDMRFGYGIDGLVNYYGFIPVNRGKLDRVAMRKASDVLRQGGVLGIFPEGGTWDPGHMRAQIGVAMFSHQGQAPVVPIGFSGFQNALNRLLKRPSFRMRVGNPIPPLDLKKSFLGVKEAMQEYADRILLEIRNLVDEEEKLATPDTASYSLNLFEVDDASRAKPLPALQGGRALAHILHSSVFLDGLWKALKLPIDALIPDDQPDTNTDMLNAIRAILDYLKANPAFFTYRLGKDEGSQVSVALESLEQKLEAARSMGRKLVLEAKAMLTYPDGRLDTCEYQYVIIPR